MLCVVCKERNTNTIRYGNQPTCDSCFELEQKLQADNMTPEKQQERIDEVNSFNLALQKAREIDNGIQVRSDLFNAATVAIIDLKKSIDSDESIENKPYALAEELKRRFEHYKDVVFELNAKIMEAGNQQKAIQVYLNNLANQLRTEEREKLKLADMNYKPTPPKQVKTREISTTGTRAKRVKFDKVELRKYASELGVSEFTLQMVVTQKGCTVHEAAVQLKRTIDAGKTS